MTVREGARVGRLKFESLEEALDALESRARAIAQNANARALDLKVREFQPIQQVAGRVELAGPRRLRGGIDIRGDGSVESYTGWLRRRLIEQRDGESAYAALRRTLTAT